MHGTHGKLTVPVVRLIFHDQINYRYHNLMLLTIFVSGFSNIRFLMEDSATFPNHVIISFSLKKKPLKLLKNIITMQTVWKKGIALPNEECIL